MNGNKVLNRYLKIIQNYYLWMVQNQKKYGNRYSVKFIDGKYYRYRTEFGIVKKCLVTRCFYYCIECCCWSMARCIRNCGCRSRTGPDIEMRNRYQEDVLNMNEDNYVTDEEMY